MSQDSQQDQSHVIGEMFDAANISQPAPSQGIPGGLTSDNVQQPVPRPEWPPANNGFTTDNLQQPTPASGPIQENSDE